MLPPVLYLLGILLALVALYLLSCIRVLFEYDRGVVFRLGRVLPQPKGPGLILIFSGTIPQDDFGEQIRSLVVILERDPDLANQMLILRRAGA